MAINTVTELGTVQHPFTLKTLGKLGQEQSSLVLVNSIGRHSSPGVGCVRPEPARRRAHEGPAQRHTGLLATQRERGGCVPIGE